MTEGWADHPVYDMNVPIVRVELKRINLAGQVAIDDALLMNSTVQGEKDYILGKMLFKMRSFIWGQEGRLARVRWPRDWWEALKERWAPRWFRDRWPVRYAWIDLQGLALYPTIQAKIPDHEPYLTIAVLKEEGVQWKPSSTRS